ncbi:SPFH domain-containing protein [Aliarcobacter butzleri]|uniref:SPFH domain-containing protein n=1 Tax=Aliarcobacter butzleri TaxID=28197 RepID=UPI0021B3FA2D|nr:SPFH domain-containing protein [Aliarcobacter butzleri]MCT7634743.1 SPFH domain-containing protein [Aliarcobacter butzleri]
MALIDRIKYDAPSDDVIVWKYPHEDIKLGAQLIVNESQEAILFKGGKALDTFGPGTHTLSSGNIPLLNKIINLPFGGDTPFTAEVWYINKTVKRNLKWGTKGSIQLIDPLYNYPVSVRAFGIWGMRINDSRSFITQIIGSQSFSNSKNYIGTERVEDYFIGEIVQRLQDALSKYFIHKNISAFQANAYINELSSFISNDISREFDRFGIEIVNFNIERISIPEDEMKKFQEILGKRMEIDQISQAKVGQAYTAMRTFDTLEKAAENDSTAGGIFGAGLGLGLGVGAGVPIGQQLGEQMNINSQTQTGDDTDEIMKKMNKLKQLFNNNLITEDEYNQKRKQLLEMI